MHGFVPVRLVSYFSARALKSVSDPLGEMKLVVLSYRLSQVKDSIEVHKNAAVTQICTNSTDVWHESLGWAVPALSLLALLLGVATIFHGKEFIQEHETNKVTEMRTGK